MRVLIFGLFLFAPGCGHFAHVWEVISTRTTPGELAPGEQIIDGGLRVLSHPGDLAAWGQLVVGAATIGVALFGGRKILKARAKKRAAAAAAVKPAKSAKT